jgi:hypothetical protein
MRSAPPPSWFLPKGDPSMPPPLRITAKSQVPSGRAAPAPARSQFARAQSPPHTPHGQAGGGKPASPAPLRSAAARLAARRPSKRLRTPPPGAAVFRSFLPPHRAPGQPPRHSQPALKEGASGDRQSRRPRTLAPQDSGLPGMRFGRAGEQSGRLGSRCRLRGRRFKRCPRRVLRFRARASLVQLGRSCGIA